MRKAILILVFIVTGCAAPKPAPEIEIRTAPSQADITLDGESLGVSPITHKIDFSTQDQYSITAKKTGYFTETTEVTSSDVSGDSNEVFIKLIPSPMWQATFESPAANQWLRLIASPSVSEAEIWKQMVDAATKRFPDLEEFDYNSGYIKSAVKTKRYSTPRGEFRLRSRFVAALADQDPLTYKIKLISEWTDKGVEWYPYNRVFREDALLIDELVDRFGME